MTLPLNYAAPEKNVWILGYIFLSCPSVVLLFFFIISYRAPGAIADMLAPPGDNSAWLDIMHTWDERIEHMLESSGAWCAGFLVLFTIAMAIPAFHSRVKENLRFWYIPLGLDWFILLVLVFTPRFR